MEIEVINYIKEAQAHGLTEPEIKQNLLNAGWEAETVESSFAHVRAENGGASVMPSVSETAAQPALAHENTSAQPLPMGSSQPAEPSYTNISEQHFAGSSAAGKSFFKKPVFWAVVILIVLLGGGGYVFYTYAYNNPTKVWEKFTGSKRTPIYKSKFQAAYSDPGNLDSLGELAKEIPFQIKDISLSFNGDFYIDGTDPKNPQSKSDVKYSFSMGDTSFTTGFNYKLINKILYLNVGSNPFLASAFANLSPNEKIEWVSLDLGQLQDEVNKDSSKEGEMFNEVFNPSFRSELQKIWDDASFVKVDKYMGRDKVNGVTVLHFKNTLDKQAIKNTLIAYVEKIVGAFKEKGAKIEDKDTNLVKTAINTLVDKMEVKEFETWVGVRDFRLYRVHFVSNAPSVISLIKAAAGEAQSKSQDAKRVADMRQMASALELYYNDFDGYPDGKDGSPVGISPTYIGTVPTAPAKGGACTDYYNTYWYQPTGTKKVVKGVTLYSSYEMTFCLGSPTGGYPAGIAKLSPAGLEGGLACTGKPEQCGGLVAASQEKASDAPQLPPSPDTLALPKPQGQSAEDKIKETINKWDFSANFTVDSDYSDYGKTEKLEAPEKFFDLMKVIKGEVQGAFTNIPSLKK